MAHFAGIPISEQAEMSPDELEYWYKHAVEFHKKMNPQK